MKFKRIICLFLCALVMTGALSFSTTAFASDMDYYYPEEETTTLSEEDAKEFANGKTNYYTVNNTVSQIISLYTKMSGYSKDELEYFNVLAANIPDSFYASFLEILKENDLGAYKESEKLKVKDNPEKKDSILAETVLKFEKANINMKVELMAFDKMGLQIISSETAIKDIISGKKQETGESTLSAKLKEAGTNTIMGMGTVFVVLILISLIIYCFKYVNKASAYFENKGKNVKPSEVNNANTNTQTSVEVNNEMDDLELVAVITAAIAASETTGDGFVVRSIRKR